MSDRSGRIYKRGAQLLRAVLLCPILAAASAAQTKPSQQNIAVTVRAIANITDLTATTQVGAISLTWTEPGRRGDAAPEAYDIRVSTVGQISDNASFAAASPLSAFSGSPIPSPGPGGGKAVFIVTGLTSPVTFYFAMRESDSSVPKLQGAWVRSVAQGWNVNNYALGFTSSAPNAITDLSGLPGSGEGAVNLSWTAPSNQNLVAISSYVVHFATFSIASLAGNTTAWFNLTASSSVTLAPAQPPGYRETLTLSGLYPASTFYFAVKSIDALGEVSPIDVRAAAPGSQASVLPSDLPPPTPTGLAAASASTSVVLSWNAQPPGDLDFAYFLLQRSTTAGSGFVQIGTATALSFVDSPLVPLAVYYYRIGAVDASGLASVFSSTVAAIPGAIPPMQPLNFRVTANNGNNVTLAWDQTVRFQNGKPFANPANPSASELQGYDIVRSTGYCAAPSTIAVNGVFNTSFTDTTGGLPYLYQLRSFNLSGPSSATAFMDQFGNQVFVLPDCVTRIQVSNNLLNTINAGYGQPLLITGELHPEEETGKVVTAAHFRALLGGTTELANFAFSQPVDVVLHFVTSGTAIVPAGLRAADLAAAEHNLGMYWNNGLEFVKMYGKVDENAQTVAVQTPNLGRYQVRTLQRDAGVTFDISNITSRVFTPNGDGKNDVVIFTFDNPNGAVVEGKIYDLRGAFVTTMSAGPMSNTLMWDGKANGRVVTSGVYVYQLTGDGKTFNGTIVVAR